MGFDHRTVMGPEAVRFIDPKPGRVYVDGTVGGGGHAAELLKAAQGNIRLIGMDVDEEALTATRARLKEFGESVTLVHRNFREIKSLMAELDIDGIDGLLLDLGVSSHQFDTGERGFSFRFDAALDMRMDKSQTLTAYDIVNIEDASRLEDIFRKYGEERRARSIARAIVRARESGPVETTGELAEIVVRATPPKFRFGPMHPATRVFQALRIAVNDELESLKQGLADGVAVLRPGGRVVVISFHSLEDRIVKQTFRELSVSCVCPPRFPKCVCEASPSLKVLTKRAVTPAEEETALNPRARSAKLRAAERL